MATPVLSQLPAVRVCFPLASMDIPHLLGKTQPLLFLQRHQFDTRGGMINFNVATFSDTLLSLTTGETFILQQDGDLFP